MYHIKSDHRNQVSCELICQSLVKLINQFGIENINIKVLIETAGVGRATFYRSFDVIDDVLQYQTDQIIQELITNVYSGLKDRLMISEKEIFFWFFKFWQSHTEFLRTLVRAKRLWLLENSLDRVFKTRLSFIKNLLNLSEVNWQYFIKMRALMLTSILAEWVESGEKETPDELLEVFLRSFTHIEIGSEQLSSI
jgi:AcrR family transcriptional regulator